MTTFQFDSISDASILFNAASDVLSLSGKASSYVVSTDADTNNAVVTQGGKSLILTGTTMAQLTTSNLLVTDASETIIIGDNMVDTTNDDLAQATGGALDLTGNALLDANNVIYGLGGGDTITVGAGDNLIFGGKGIVDETDGSDTIIINGASTTSGSNTIFANAGDDTILFTDPTGATRITYLFSGLGNDDVITGAAAGDNVLFGNAGNDTLNGSASTGTLVIYGGNGEVDSVDGADVLISGLGNSSVYGNAGDDVIQFDDFGSGITQVIYAGLGDDTVSGDADGSGSTGSLAVFGNAGADALDVSSHTGAVSVYGGNGAEDTTDGADTLTIGGSASLAANVFGNAGADTINIVSGVADGAAINVFAGLGADVMNLGGVRGDSATVVLAGNEGNDTFNIDDAALTEDATTTFSGFEETDVVNLTVKGGTATDFDVTGLGASVTLDNTAADGKYVFTNYTGNFSTTNLVLSDGSAIITNVGDEAGSLTGTANNDLLIAGSAGDTLSGAAGDDIIKGGDSGDSIDGGDGVDSIYGNEGNDTINAGDGGADGGTADSVIDGGDGADSITGGTFEDSIVGGSGHDTIVGGLDADTITGGIGNDVYQYAVAEVDATDTNVDQITDAFVTGVDQFGFSDLDNTTLRGTGASFASGAADSAQALAANIGLYVMTNTVGDFSEATIYSELSGIADDLAVGDALYVLASNGTDARLAKVTNTANAGLAAADDDLGFVARLDGVDAGDLAALSAGNFVDFV